MVAGVVWSGAVASSWGVRLSVPCPVQRPAQQPCTVDGLGKCWQKSAGTGPWAGGPRQVTRRRWVPSPQETEHCVQVLTCQLWLQSATTQGTLARGRTRAAQAAPSTSVSWPWSSCTHATERVAVPRPQLAEHGPRDMTFHLGGQGSGLQASCCSGRGSPWHWASGRISSSLSSPRARAQYRILRTTPPPQLTLQAASLYRHLAGQGSGLQSSKGPGLGTGQHLA